MSDLDDLHGVLCNPEAQHGLIQLYIQSQSECTRNGVCGMEIGMAREKDLGAVLKLFLQEKINLNVDNTLPEDYVVGTSKISVKHASTKVGSTVKVKWTAADTPVTDAITAIINADDAYYPNLLILYLDKVCKKIVVVCIAAETNRNVIKTLRERAFKVPKGNSRGIEYSKDAMAELMKAKYFEVQLADVDWSNGQDPIERRIQYLQSLGIGLHYGRVIVEV